MRRTSRLSCLALLLAACTSVRGDDLEQGFITPGDATRPRCYWYWLDGHITKDGITKDLESMKRVGIGEAYIGMIADQSGLPANPDLKPLTDPWWETITHAIREGGRLGVDIGLFNSPGWSQSGGPWVKAEQSMRYVALPETRLHGPNHFDGKLNAPEGDFQDFAVMAFPVTADDQPDAGKQTRTPTTIDIEFASPIAARSVTIQPTREVNVSAELSVSDDRKTFRAVKTFAVDRHRNDIQVGPVPLAAIVETIPATKGRFFRLTFSNACEVGDVRVSSAARVERFMEKQLAKVFEEPQPPFDFYSWPLAKEPDEASSVIAPDAVKNLTKQMDADGTLHWDVPAGDWVVVRAVMRPTGTRNSPAAPEATGLEIDKMNRAHVASHFDAYVGELLRRMPVNDRKAWKHVVADSYEKGPENWTDGFAGDFRQRYGYDPLPYLPAMTGRIVGSADQSDRFLWDLRRLVADRIAEQYVGGLRELCNKNGLKLWLENYGHWGFPSEFLKYGGATDEVGGEFWVGGPQELGSLGSVELRDASSAAHIYGKPVVWAEAFTGGPQFVNSPRDIKAREDWAMCQGINQFTLHVYIHQPDDRAPGISAWFGTEFNRNNTWFEMSKSWFDYQRRCTHLLQRGLHVADVAYYIGEDAPKMAGLRHPALPNGYDFDYINGEVLLTRAKVENGRLTLPDGMSFKLLVLPPSETMRPEVLAKIATFADEGLAVFGPLPTRSPSLQNFPAADADVKRLAAQLKDKVTNGPDLSPALQEPADVAGLPAGKVLFIHRHADDADIYFLSNQTDATVSLEPEFRVSGMASELWHPDTGEIERVESSPAGGGHASRVPLQLEAHGSVFVVFRKTSDRAPPAKDVAEVAAGSAIGGPWKVQFPDQTITFDALTSWTNRPEPDIKYFSGTATYSTKFIASDIGKRVILDLGEVDAIAEITLNGHTLPAVWKYPYRADITSAIKAGDNELSVRVVNVWHNRLVGEAREPTKLAPPHAWASTSPRYGADEALLPSGLIGPVTVQGAVSR